MSTLTETTAPPSEASLVGTPRAETGDARLVFIDALRGIAALAVAAYHIERYGPLARPASRIIEGPLENVIRHGWMGVQVFFVISGFVIAYSLRKAWMTPGYLGNYALRRSIRLDPPYWATIAVALALHFLAPRLLNIPSPMDASPTGRQIAWHALYLQNVMGYDNLSVGLWTLCIEVQFYLLYAIMLAVAQRFCGAARWQRGGGGAALIACFTPLAIISLAVYRHEEAFTAPALAWLAPFRSDVCVLRYFWMFFLGMLVHWTLEGRTPKWLVWTYLACMAARYAWYETDEIQTGLTAAIRKRWTIEVVVAGAAGATIFVVGSLGRLATFGAQRWLQFLGKTSYSLYLIHYPVSHVVVHLCDQWGRRQSWHASQLYDWYALACTALALLIAIGAGYLLYVFVERPSQRLAARFRRGGGSDPKRRGAVEPINPQTPVPSNS